MIFYYVIKYLMIEEMIKYLMIEEMSCIKREEKVALWEQYWQPDFLKVNECVQLHHASVYSAVRSST